MKKRILKDESERLGVSVEKQREYVEKLSKLINCKTVFTKNGENAAEFEKFYSEIATLFPLLTAKAERLTFGSGCFVYIVRGKGAKKNIMLMSHHDVVDGSDTWDTDPFVATERDGYLFGRGTIDTKTPLFAELQAIEELLSEGYELDGFDLYIASSNNEEVSGDGMVLATEYFKKNGIEPSVVLDEGGAVVEKVFPGVSAPCALIGIAEKGILNLRYEVSSNGGHASAPKPHTPVGALARACTRVEASPFKCHITEPVAQMFDTLGRHSSFIYRIIFANRWCLSPFLDAMAKRSGGEMNALLRTTVAFTQMSGSSAPNVIPTEASMVSNVRLNPKDSIESATEYIRRVINDENVRVEVINGTEPSRISTTDCDGWRKLSAAVEETWQGAIVSPYLMVQCSDSRHYGAISDKVYRFSAMALTSKERATIHGNNERVTLEGISQAVEFYIRFIKRL